MRISDWSSDVCSSDLLVGKLGRLLRIGSRADDVPRSASGLIRWSESKGFKRTQEVGGPIKYVDGKGVVRVPIKRGSARAPGGGTHPVAVRKSSGNRIGPHRKQSQWEEGGGGGGG